MTTFLYKVTQILGDFWGYFEKHHLFSENYSGCFWATFEIFWATFYTNIWSHCSGLDSWSLNLKAPGRRRRLWWWPRRCHVRPRTRHATKQNKISQWRGTLEKEELPTNRLPDNFPFQHRYLVRHYYSKWLYSSLRKRSGSVTVTIKNLAYHYI